MNTQQIIKLWCDVYERNCGTQGAVNLRRLLIDSIMEDMYAYRIARDYETIGEILRLCVAKYITAQGEGNGITAELLTACTEESKGEKTKLGCNRDIVIAMAKYMYGIAD